ncbi:MAG TPA: glycosyltransferase family 2 protein, partial [Caldilineae bacterium]|nr:glycosyltransferase family 2 protein [Caldilineae bacterium]
MSAFDLSVIIVNWNAAAYLPAALESLFTAQGDLRMEVLLVDNASTDDSIQVVQRRFPQVEVLENHENRGYAAANNQGLVWAQGRYILLLNPDTEMPATALRLFIAYLKAHPEVGVVGPRLQAKRGKIQGGAAGYDPSLSTIFNFSTFLYRLLPGYFKGLWLPRSRYKQADPVQVDWVSGACMMVRREAFTAAGLLDERYFMYSEDVEWCRRIRQAGFQVACLPTVAVTHHVGGSSRQLGPAFYAHNIDSLDLDLRSRYNAATVALMHLIGAFGFLLRYLLGEVTYLRQRQPVYAEIRDLWAACLKTSLIRIFRPTPSAPSAPQSPTS